MGKFYSNVLTNYTGGGRILPDCDSSPVNSLPTSKHFYEGNGLVRVGKDPVPDHSCYGYSGRPPAFPDLDPKTLRITHLSSDVFFTDGSKVSVSFYTSFGKTINE